MCVFIHEDWWIGRTDSYKVLLKVLVLIIAIFFVSIVNNHDALYAGAPKTITDKLQRVLNAAARVVGDTKKYDRGLSTLLHDELHWFNRCVRKGNQFSSVQ